MCCSMTSLMERPRVTAESRGVYGRMVGILSRYSADLTPTGEGLLDNLRAGRPVSMKTEGLEGKTDVQLIEALAHHTSKERGFSEGPFVDVPQFATFSRGCLNNCPFCSFGNWKKPIEQQSYPRVAARVVDHFRRDGNGGLDFGFSSNDSDPMIYHSDGADIADVIRFYQECAAKYGMKRHMKILTAGSPPRLGQFREIFEKLRNLKVDPKLFSVAVTYNLFRTDVISTALLAGRSVSRENQEKMQHVLREYSDMYSGLLSSWGPAEVRVTCKGLQPRDKKDPNFPAVLKAVDRMQDQVLSEVESRARGNLDIVKCDYYTIVWDVTQGGSDYVQRLKGAEGDFFSLNYEPSFFRRAGTSLKVLGKRFGLK